MKNDIPEIVDNPKAACESFIRELETYYYSWYDGTSTRNYYVWFVAQSMSLLAGFATALIAALLGTEQFKSWSTGRILLVVLPVLGSLASTYLLQSHIGELAGLREDGRQRIQELANQARVDFAAATSPQEYSAIHAKLVQDVTALEREQTRAFHRIVPKQLSFRSHGAPRTRR